MRLKKSIEELVNEFKTVDWDAAPDRPDVATDDFFYRHGVQAFR